MMHLDLDSRSKIIGARYYLHQLIAQTQYSKVFIATDLSLGYRQCVVKQLYPSYCPVERRPKVESAFLHEVEILKKCASKHPQICGFYNYFVDSGNQYLVQEWVEGMTLEQKVGQQSKLSQSETKNVLLNILSALECIHGLGIVHNDIKPNNIIWRSQDNLPVLIDFGIARKVNTDYGQNIVGTPGYMSLEQAMGKTDYSNDLYSLGLTAIYLLTGKSPQGISLNSEQDNFWHQEKTAFDPKLVATIDRAIAIQPLKRFASAREMRAELEFTKQKLIVNPPNLNRTKLKSRNLIPAVILAISATWLYLSYFIPQPSSKPPITISDSFPAESLTPSFTGDELRSTQPTQSTILETTNQALQNVTFVPGTSEKIVLQTLGEPLWRKPGFWANSIAWSYENIISEGIDLGYIFDRQTKTLRQAEIAVPPATDLSTIQLAMSSFLATKSLPAEIQQGLQAVYQRQKTSHNFAAGKLKGIIQRNSYNRIYIGVWSADFH